MFKSVFTIKIIYTYTSVASLAQDYAEERAGEAGAVLPLCPAAALAATATNCPVLRA